MLQVPGVMQKKFFFCLIWYSIDNWRKHAKQYALHAFNKIINTASTCGRSGQIKYHLQRSSSGTWYILKHGNIGSSGLWGQILNENVIPHNKSFCSYVHYWNKGTSRLINQHRVLSKNKKKRIFRNSCININQRKILWNQTICNSRVWHKLCNEQKHEPMIYIYAFHYLISEV